MTDNADIKSIEHQLQNKREALLLIQERKSQYVLDTDVPLELIKEERETEGEIADLEARLNTLRLNVPVRSSGVSTSVKKTGFIVGGGCVVMLLVLILLVSQVTKLLRPKATLANPTGQPTVVNGSEINLNVTATPQTGGKQGTAVLQSTATPAAGLVFAPPTFTPTPTAVAALNLTNNREGGYDNLKVMYDSQGILHMVFYTRIQRTSGDYFHMQLPPGGTWSSPEVLTDGVKYMQGNMIMARAPGGYICVYIAATIDKEALYQRCQNGPGGEFGPIEQWMPKYVSARSGFSVQFSSDGKAQTVLLRIGGGFYIQDRMIYPGDDSVSSPFFLIDSNGIYHLVWFRGGDPYSLEYLVSKDSGNSWGEQQRLTDVGNKPDIWLDVKTDGVGNLHLSWKGYDGGVYYRRWSAASGWSETVKVLDKNCFPKVNANQSGLARVMANCFDGIYYLEQNADGTWLPPYKVSELGHAAQRGFEFAIDSKDHVTVLLIRDKDIQTFDFQAGVLAH